MDSLLHWDFSPGLKVEAQVRARFGSTVHYVLNPGFKEFFLEVSFSSASFPLSVESVGLALQSCIGGISDGFNVIRLGVRHFRFSVASNRVGHFIFGLRDRIWPDFICHFHLHRGVVSQPRIQSWYADTELNGLASSPGPAIRSKWLSSHHNVPMDPASVPVFQKLGLISPPTDLHSGEPPAEISFGSFLAPVSKENFRIGTISLPIFSDIPATLPSFRGELFTKGLWDSIPDNTLYSILDGWQAGYDNDSVKLMVQITSVPTKDYIYKRLKHCSICDRLGHVAETYTGIFFQ